MAPLPVLPQVVISRAPQAPGARAGRRTGETQARDRELVFAARAGESWAGAALYRRHRGMAYRIASRLARPADRDDLVQDSFLDALANLRQLRNPELFGSWLASVVTRTAARRHRRLRRLTSLDRDDGLPCDRLISPIAPPDVFAELGGIDRLLSMLPFEVSLVFVLRRVERMSIDEVSARIGRSVATVKRRLADAERMLNKGMSQGPSRLQRERSARPAGNS